MATNTSMPAGLRSAHRSLVRRTTTATPHRVIAKKFPSVFPQKKALVRPVADTMVANKIPSADQDKFKPKSVLVEEYASALAQTIAVGMIGVIVIPTIAPVTKLLLAGNVVIAIAKAILRSRIASTSVPVTREKSKPRPAITMDHKTESAKTTAPGEA